MTATRTPCPSFGELADYWTSDITPDEAEQIGVSSRKAVGSVEEYFLEKESEAEKQDVAA